MTHDIIAKVGSSNNTEDLMTAVVKIAWYNVNMNSFRELVCPYRQHLMAIYSADVLMIVTSSPYTYA